MASRRNIWLALAAALVFLGLALLLVSDDADEGAGAPVPAGDGFDAERAFADLRAQVELGPRPAGSPANAEQAELLAERLEQAGAEDVAIQQPHANVVGTIPGSEPGYVVVGAHHDTEDVPGLLGANDAAQGRPEVDRLGSHEAEHHPAVSDSFPGSHRRVAPSRASTRPASRAGPRNQPQSSPAGARKRTSDATAGGSQRSLWTG